MAGGGQGSGAPELGNIVFVEIGTAVADPGGLEPLLEDCRAQAFYILVTNLNLIHSVSNNLILVPNSSPF